MSDYNLGTARGRIEVDASGAEQGAKRAEKAVGGFTGKVQKAGPGLVAAGAAVGAFGAVVGVGFGIAVKSAMDYEARMSAVQAVSGASSAEMKQLSGLALQLGKDTKFSASEAASAIEELVKAGVSVPDVMNGAAAATVALAAAGEISLPAAATIASNAMNQFGLSAKEMPKVADAIAGAANASAIDVSEFGSSLAQVGAVANLAGFSFEDTAVAIAEMGNAGIKGSDAGTSLKTMFQNLIPQTEAQVTKFRELGLLAVGNTESMKKLAALGIKPVSRSYSDVSKAIAQYVQDSGGAKVGTAKNNKATQELGNRLGALKNQFFDANGKVKSMAQVQGVLAKAFKGSSKESLLAAQGLIFGSDAIRASAVLTKEGAGGFNKMSDAMGKMTAADVAKTRMDNLKGSLEQAKGSAETLGIQVGQILLPALKSIVDAVTKVVNWFISLDDGTKKTILIIIGIVAAISLVLGGILAFVGAIGMLLAALAPLAAVIGITAGVLLGWIAVIALVVVAVVAIAVLIWKNWDSIKAKTLEIWGAITAFFKGWWAEIQSEFSTAVNAVKSAITVAWNAVKGVWVTVWTAISTFFSGVWAAIVGFVTSYINLVKGVITAGLNVIKGIWAAVWGLFGPLVMAVWNLIKAIVQLGMAAVMFVVRSVLLGIKAVWSAVWGAISKVASVIWTAISSVIRTAANNIKNNVTAIFNAVRGVITSIFNGIRAVAVSVWNAIKNAMTGPINAARSAVVSTVNGIKGTVTSVWNAVKGATVAAWNGIKTAMTGPINSAKSLISNAIGNIKGLFSGAGSWLANAGRSIIQGLIDGVTSKITALTDKLKAITKLIPQHKGPERVDKRLLFDSGSYIMDSLNRGLDHGWMDVERNLQAMTTKFPEMVRPTGPSAASKASLISSAGPTVATGPMFGEGAITVHAPQNMSPEQVGSAVASKVVHRVATGSTSIPAPVRSR